MHTKKLLKIARFFLTKENNPCNIKYFLLEEHSLPLLLNLSFQSYGKPADSNGASYMRFSTLKSIRIIVIEHTMFPKPVFLDKFLTISQNHN